MLSSDTGDALTPCGRGRATGIGRAARTQSTCCRLGPARRPGTPPPSPPPQAAANSLAQRRLPSSAGRWRGEAWPPFCEPRWRQGRLLPCRSPCPLTSHQRKQPLLLPGGALPARRLPWIALRAPDLSAICCRRVAQQSQAEKFSVHDEAGAQGDTERLHQWSALRAGQSCRLADTQKRQ